MREKDLFILTRTEERIGVSISNAFIRLAYIFFVK